MTPPAPPSPPPAPPQPQDGKHAWDLEDPSVFSPVWGTWTAGSYALAHSILAKDAAVMVKAAAPGARLITDTLDGTDVPRIGATHVWTIFSNPASGPVTLYAMFKSAPVRVLIDGRPVSGAACQYDTPPGGTCVDIACASVSVHLSAGPHVIDIKYDSPGVVALAAVTSAAGSVLAATDRSWFVTWDAASTQDQTVAVPQVKNLPSPPQAPFRLLHPASLLPISFDASSWSPCGDAGMMRISNGVPITFEQSSDQSTYGWALGFSRLSFNGTKSRLCYGSMRASRLVPPDSQDAAFRLVPVSGGGWILCTPSLCAGYNATLDAVVFLPTNSSKIVGWVLRVWPDMPAETGALPLWLDGSDVSSIRTDGTGRVLSWRDTRDSGVVTPRTTLASGLVTADSLSCPLRFKGGSLFQQWGWDWSVPTSITVVVSQTAGGPLMQTTDASGSGNNNRSLELLAAADQGPMSVRLAASDILDTPQVVSQRSFAPVTISALRTTPATWTIYVNGLQSTSGPFGLSYGPGESLTIGSLFDGCIHEVIVHALVLSDADIFALASYMGSKWSVATPTAIAASSPPPPLSPLSEQYALPLTSWSVAGGGTTPVPADLAATGDANTTCISGYGELGFNGTAALDATELYVLEFKVASV